MKSISTGRAILSWVLAAVVGAAFPANPAAADPGAEALVFNRAGVGHLLIVPYYSTQAGNATLISLVNTDDAHGKAVKIRFRGASNADTVFDFQLFLAPGGTWTASVGRGTSGLARLATTDRSCTLPANINRDFDTSRLSFAQFGDDLASETREGYVEMITMGDIPTGAGPNSLGHAILPGADGVAPCTAALLGSLTVGDTRLDAPSTGLLANWSIINVPNTTVWSSSAEAIEVQSNGAAATGRNVYWPQTASPLSLAEIEANTADPLLRLGTVTGLRRDLPDLSTPYVSGSASPIAQANALSDSLAATMVAAEFTSNAEISSSTDWVFSQPTRRYYIAIDYAGTTPGEKLITNFNQFGILLADYYRSILVNAAQIEPGKLSNGNMLHGNAANGGKPWQACFNLTGIAFWNREEFRPVFTGIVTLGPPPPPWLCGTVAVLGLDSPDSPVGATVTRVKTSPTTPLADGWVMIFARNARGEVTPGYPMLVQQFSRATNPAVSAGVSDTFGGVWKGRVVQRGAYHAR